MNTLFFLALTCFAPAQGKPSEQQKQPVYDEAANASQQIETALARAERDERRVLIQWGANWCGWCVLLHDLMQSNKDLQHELLYEYEVVKVDMGKFDKNVDLAKAYQADVKTHGIPFLTILDGNGKILTNQETSSLEASIDGKQGHDPAKVLELLRKYQAVPRKADEVFAGAIQLAAMEDKHIFLHFGAPWCGWCHRMEDWMAKPEVAAILAKDFVDCKIDQDRNAGGKDILAKFNTTGQGGIPWFVFLDKSGTALVNSNGPKGNVGFPYEEFEIAHFVEMLQKSCKRISAEDIATLEASLNANRK